VVGVVPPSSRTLGGRLKATGRVATPDRMALPTRLAHWGMRRWISLRPLCTYRSHIRTTWLFSSAK
jgi:hypothetical protein